jgi:hypothetical protein
MVEIISIKTGVVKYLKYFPFTVLEAKSPEIKGAEYVCMPFVT